MDNTTRVICNAIGTRPTCTNCHMASVHEIKDSKHCNFNFDAKPVPEFFNQVKVNSWIKARISFQNTPGLEELPVMEYTTKVISIYWDEQGRKVFRCQKEGDKLFDHLYEHEVIGLSAPELKNLLGGYTL